jgi:hypothetical protein
MESTENNAENTGRRTLDALLSLSQELAESRELQRKVMERLFLLGISIGQRRMLTPEESIAYGRTVVTARQLTLMEDLSQGTGEYDEHNRRNMANAVMDWLRAEPELRKSLEEELDCDLSAPSPAGLLDQETRDEVARMLHAIAETTPEALRKEEIHSIVEKLDHPLDRP